MPKLLQEYDELFQQEVLDYLAEAVPTHVEYTALEPPYDTTTAVYPYIKRYDRDGYTVEQVYQWNTADEYTTMILVYEL